MQIRRERSSERVQPLASSSPALAQPRIRPLSLAACIRRLVRWATRIGYRFRRIGGQTVLMAPIGHGQPRTLFGERPTCPMYGEAHTFPTAATVTGARYGIPMQNGESRTEVGVIPSS